MTTTQCPDLPLYSFEDPAEFARMAQLLRQEHRPETPEEEQLWESMVSASWLKGRYERVRGKLYDRRKTIEEQDPESPLIEQLATSIHHFQREVEKQKRMFSTSRKALRKLRETGELQEGDHEFADAA